MLMTIYPFNFYKCPEIFISAKALTLQQFTDRLNNHSRSLGSLEFILKAHVFYFILRISDVYIFFSYLVSLWRSHSLFNVNGILGCVCKFIFNDNWMFITVTTFNIAVTTTVVT
jgi:hypothetical protein